MAIWLRLLLILIAVSGEERDFQFLVDTFHIKVWIPEIFDELNYTLSQLNNRSYINGHVLFARNIDDLIINTTMDYWKSDKAKKRRIYNFKMNACLLYGAAHKNRLLSVFSKTFRNHSMQGFECPLKAHFNYTVENWHLDELDFPSYTPGGIYQTSSDYYIENQKHFRLVTRCNVIY